MHPKPKPGNCLASEKNALVLLRAGTLDDWESDFLKSLAKLTEWTPAQRANFRRIRDRYLRPSGGVWEGEAPTSAPRREGRPREGHDLPPHVRDDDR